LAGLLSAALHAKEAFRELRRGSAGAANVEWLEVLLKERAGATAESAPVCSAATEAIFRAVLMTLQSRIVVDKFGRKLLESGKTFRNWFGSSACSNGNKNVGSEGNLTLSYRYGYREHRMSEYLEGRKGRGQRTDVIH
jgi:hypothetical protein